MSLRQVLAAAKSLASANPTSSRAQTRAQTFLVGGLVVALLGAALVSAVRERSGNASEGGPTKHLMFELGEVKVDKVKTNGFANVDVAIGGALASAEADCEASVLRRVHTEVKGDTLTIWTDGDNDIHLGGSGPCVVHAKVPALHQLSASGSGDVAVTGEADGLTSVELAGSGDVEIDRAKADSLRVATRGSGGVDLKSAHAQHITIETNGSGDVKIAGDAERANVSCSGSGDIDAEHLATKDAEVASHGSCGIDLQITHRADVTTSGSGDVKVSGHPAERNVKHHGSGEVVFE
jgi:hypothetical protein